MGLHLALEAVNKVFCLGFLASTSDFGPRPTADDPSAALAFASAVQVRSKACLVARSAKRAWTSSYALLLVI